MNNFSLTKEAYLDLKHMISDTEFRELLFRDEKEMAKYVQVVSNGEIILGKTKYKFINRLFNDEKILSVNDLCIKLIQTITGKGGARNIEAFQSLIQDLNIALEKRDYSYAITRIFIAYRLGYKTDINTATANKPIVDEKDKANYVLAKDGFGQPYAILLGKYKH